MSDDLVQEMPENGEVDSVNEQMVKSPRKPREAGHGGIRLYKPGQGFYTRVGTAIGVGVLILWGGKFLFDELSGMLGSGSSSASYALPLQYGIATGFILVMGLVLYWVVGINRKANDFFIATEGEMKKVNWSTKQEIVRSTKVVVLVTIVMSVFLFAADLLFMMIFSSLGVLRAGPTLLEIFGIKG
ncbi:MAG: preprotein translocase subunit SecE [Phycisphaerales bacterium]|nr:preprotein translocase subunit SecE [Phycisphaerales bacterium]